MGLSLDLTDANLLRVLVIALDVSIVAFLIYKVISLFKGTPAISLMKGLAILFAANAAAEYLKLDALYWLLRQATTMTLIGIPIVFQPEVRRGLEQLGRGRLFGSGMAAMGPEELRRLISEVVRSAAIMSRERTGALIVIERGTGVGDVVETGTRIDSLVSAELLVNLFTPHTPLHDGAVIVRGNRLVAAGCVLPLSENQGIGRKLGTRHRASLGITEQTDAIAIVVSEETGVISLAADGKLTRNLDPDALSERLQQMLDVRHTAGAKFLFRGVGK
ncbi:MAG: diadenylate cyclase CdaA [Firmicutes bacterium]|nr:diadenylate cyclase CdaA [Bacillota bacterium]